MMPVLEGCELDASICSLRFAVVVYPYRCDERMGGLVGVEEPVIGSRGKLKHLEGLRGYAALAVVFSHCALSFFPSLHLGPPFTEYWQLVVFNSPLAFFYSGIAAVFVFFTLSGFVLSIGFFQTLDPNRIRELFLKRYPRLMIPVVASCVLTVILQRLGAFTALSTDLGQFLKSFYVSPLTVDGAFFQGMFGTFFKGQAAYNFVLWTMQIELFGSLLVFFNCVFLNGVRFRSAFYALECLALVYLLGNVGLYYVSFIVGMFFAQYRKMNIPEWAAALFLAGALFLGSYHPASYMSFIEVLIVPNYTDQLCYFFAGILLLLGALYSTRAQRFLSSKVSVFMGRISFSLYLIHSLVLASAGVFAYRLAHVYAGSDLSGAVSTVMTVIAAILAAWIFYPVDAAAIRLSGIGAKLLLKEPRFRRTKSGFSRDKAPVVLNYPVKEAWSSSRAEEVVKAAVGVR
jgi:peptidoglycan/LPS O-acetylase OafA/YrhL